MKKQRQRLLKRKTNQIVIRLHKQHWLLENNRKKSLQNFKTVYFEIIILYHPNIILSNIVVWIIEWLL